MANFTRGAKKAAAAKKGHKKISHRKSAAGSRKAAHTRWGKRKSKPNMNYDKLSRGSKGFKSKAQWRLFFANKRLKKYARKKAHATPGGKKVRYRRLPNRKGVKKR